MVPGDFFRDGDVVRIQVHIVGDQKFARGDSHGAGRGMQPGPADIGSALLVSRRLLAQVLEFAAPHTLQPFALGPQRRLLVKISGNPMPRPNLSARLARQFDALFHCRAFNRNKRQHIDRPDPRMLSGMAAEVDRFRGLGHTAQCRFQHGPRFSGQCDHRAIVIGVGVHVEHPGSPNAAHRPHQSLNSLAVATLGEIRNAFDQACQGSSPLGRPHLTAPLET